MRRPAIFISSSSEGLEIARELARQLKSSAAVTLWSEGAFHPGKTVTDSLTEATDRSDFAVFVLTGDDTVHPGGAPSWSARSNVLFELGFLAGRIGLSRTFLVAADPAKAALPSDVAGIMYVSLPPHQGSDLAATVAPAAAAIRKLIAGVPMRADPSPEFFSCFISYSWDDKEFAVQLYDDLREVGIRSWLDAKEMRVGEVMSEQIDRAIQAHDKVLLVLSEASVQSPWVRFEVKNALGLERATQKTVLFPIRLDDAVLSVTGAQEIESLKEKYIVDFSGWQDVNLYQRAFSRLVRDLAINASVESGRQD